MVSEGVIVSMSHMSSRTSGFRVYDDIQTLLDLVQRS